MTRKTSAPLALVLFSSFALAALGGCRDDDDQTVIPDVGGGSDGAADFGLRPELGVDGSESDVGGGSDGSRSDTGGADSTPTPDVAVADLPPPSSFKVVVTELMANPKAVADSAGEWLELYNAGSTQVDLDGWTLADEGSDSHKISGTVLIDPGQYIVLGRNSQSSANGGVTVAYQYTGYNLANGGDEVVLLDGSGLLVDRVTYSNGNGGWQIVAGASAQLTSTGVDNNMGSNWCVAATAWSGSAGDTGTPGAANNCGAGTDGGTSDGAPVDAGQTGDSGSSDASVNDGGSAPTG